MIVRLQVVETINSANVRRYTYTVNSKQFVVLQSDITTDSDCTRYAVSEYLRGHITTTFEIELNSNCTVKRSVGVVLDPNGQIFTEQSDTLFQTCIVHTWKFAVVISEGEQQ